MKISLMIRQDNYGTSQQCRHNIYCFLVYEKVRHALRSIATVCLIVSYQKRGFNKMSMLINNVSPRVHVMCSYHKYY